MKITASFKNDRGISIEFGEVGVDGFLGTLDVKNKSSIQLRQPIKTTYPAVKGGNDLTDALFATEDFGPGKEYVSSRVAWIPVPKVNNKQEEELRIKETLENLKNYPNSRIYRILSFNIMDVLNEDQKGWWKSLPVEEAKEWLEARMERYAVQVKMEDELVPYTIEGKQVYAGNFWSANGRKDIVKLGETKQVIESFKLVSETEKEEVQA